MYSHSQLYLLNNKFQPLSPPPITITFNPRSKNISLNENVYIIAADVGRKPLEINIQFMLSRIECNIEQRIICIILEELDSIGKDNLSNQITLSFVLTLSSILMKMTCKLWNPFMYVYRLNHTNYPFFQYYSANNHFVNRVSLHLIHFGTFSYVWKLYMQFGIVNMYLLEWKPLKILSYFQIRQRTRHDIDIKLSHLKSMTCM